MGMRGEVGTLLQGRIMSDVHATVGEETDDGRRLEIMKMIEARSAGQYTDYGVNNTHCDWVFSNIKEKDMTLQWIKVSVFEAEVACLPQSEVDFILQGRKQMRKMKQRIDTCVRILAGTLGKWGKGRRMAAATLDKLKAQLEKAESVDVMTTPLKQRPNALSTAGHLCAADGHEVNGNDARNHDGADANNATNATAASSGTSTTTTPLSTRRAAQDEKKRKLRAQQNAQASFMMRFVKKGANAGNASSNGGQAGGGSGSGGNVASGKDGKPRNEDGAASNTTGHSGADGAKQKSKEEEEQERVAAERKRMRAEGRFAGDIEQDRDVMPLSAWIRSEMEWVGYTQMNTYLDTPTSTPSASSSGPDAAAQTSLPEVQQQPTSDSVSVASLEKGDPDVNKTNTATAPESRAVTTSVQDLHAHLRDVAARRMEAERHVSRPMLDFRRGRREHVGDRNPRMIRTRADCRCKGVKLLQFTENYRPAYYGTWKERSQVLRKGRRPLNKDTTLRDYDVDSEEEWDEDEDGEDLSDIEDVKDKDDEDAELRKLYGSEDEDDADYDDFFDDSEEQDQDDDDDEQKENSLDLRETTAASQEPQISPNLSQNGIGVGTAVDPSNAALESATDKQKQLEKREALTAYQGQQPHEQQGSILAVSGDGAGNLTNGGINANGSGTVKECEQGDGEVQVVKETMVKKTVIDVNMTDVITGNNAFASATSKPGQAVAPAGAVTSAAGGNAGAGTKRNTKDRDRRGGEKRRKVGGHGRSGTGGRGVVIHGPVLFGRNAVLERYGVTCWEWGGEDNERGVPMYNPLVMDMRSHVAEHLGGMMPSSMSKLTSMSMLASSAPAGNTTAGINGNNHGGSGVTPVKMGKGRMDERARKALVDVLMQSDVKVKGSRERIVQEYAQACNKLGVSMPAKSVVMRVISEMASFENRGTDRGWYLKNITS